MSAIICVLSIILLASDLHKPETGVQDHTGSAAASGRDQTIGHGKVKGVVTYYFNDNFGDKGDVGAQVFLVAGTIELPREECEIQLGNDQISIPNCFSLKEVKENRDASKKHLPLPNPIRQLLIPVVDHTTVDVNGSFQLDDIAPGLYTLVVRSSHSKGNYFKKRDELGRVVCLPTIVKTEHAVDASYKFPATGRQLSREN
jgi:hypothetical protein